MKISGILSGSRSAFPSLEIVPPLSGITREELLTGIGPLMEFSPKYINVTRHRAEFEFVQRYDGSFERRVLNPRMSQEDVCAAVMERYNVDVVPHIICAGTTKDGIRSELDRYKEMGVENVMALRGDCTVGEKRFSPTPDGYSYASELVEGIRSYREAEGRYYCVGVGAYPEKHFEAPNIETDIRNLKKKIDAGADFIITQMFFDNEAFYGFESLCREAGITVPIIPGLKPLSSARQLDLLPQTFSIDIPVELSDEMKKASGDPEKAYRTGIEWSIAQCRDLLAHGVPAIHFYTMGRSRNIVEIIKNCF